MKSLPIAGVSLAICITALGLFSGGCGALIDKLANAAATDLDVELFPKATLGNPEKRVQPLTFAATVDNTHPTAGVPDSADTTAWGPVIAAHIAAIDADQPGLFSVDVANLNLVSDGPVQFQVTVTSRDGQFFGPTAGSTAASAVPACSFQLTAGVDTAATLGAHLTQCLVDSVRQMGVPHQLTYSLTASAVSSSPGRAPGDYTASHDETMTAHNAVEADCFTRKLKISSDVIDNLDVIDFENLAVHASATCDKNVGVWGAGSVLNSSGAGQASAEVLALVPAGTERRFDYEDGAVQRNDFFVSFLPALPQWLTEAIDAVTDVQAANQADGLSDALARNSVVGCYISWGAEDRTGTVSFTLSGVAKPSTDEPAQ